MFVNYAFSSPLLLLRSAFSMWKSVLPLYIMKLYEIKTQTPQKVGGLLANNSKRKSTEKMRSTVLAISAPFSTKLFLSWYPGQHRVSAESRFSSGNGYPRKCIFRGLFKTILAGLQKAMCRNMLRLLATKVSAFRPNILSISTGGMTLLDNIQFANRLIFRQKGCCGIRSRIDDLFLQPSHNYYVASEKRKYVVIKLALNCPMVLGDL